MTVTKAALERQYQLYDKIATKRRELAAMAEDSGRVARAVAEAALGGDTDVERVALDAPDYRELQVICAGLDDALHRLSQQIADAEAESRGVSAPVLQHAPRHADALREFIDNAITNTEEAAAAAEHARDVRFRYEKAFAEYTQLRGDQIRAGKDPAVATELAKAAMESPTEDLWPEGSPGPPNLTGRALDAGIFA